MVQASEPNLTALVFKIQANMDPNHRDRIAFVRVCSGRLTRGMRLKQVRTGKLIPLHAPQFFFARDRQIADEAFAGFGERDDGRRGAFALGIFQNQRLAAFHDRHAGVRGAQINT